SAGVSENVGGTASIEAYERLAELAEAELAACEGARPEELADLYSEAEAIRASLPGRPPAEAEPALRRAAAAQERIGQLLGARPAAPPGRTGAGGSGEGPAPATPRGPTRRPRTRGPRRRDWLQACRLERLAPSGRWLAPLSPARGKLSPRAAYLRPGRAKAADK